MKTGVKNLFDRLAQTGVMYVPDGEAGVAVQEGSGTTRLCVPVLSVYLDTRPLLSGDQPAMRASRVVLRERLREIAHSFWPRGVAYESVLADAQRIMAFLETEVSPATHGIAVFAQSASGLFETFACDVPFADHVSALAVPDLFQLAGLLDDHEVAVVAVAHTHAVRLFLTHRGGMREVRNLAEDPKFFHLVRRTNAMNQAHYQRHARQVRADFAREVAQEIERLVQHSGAGEVILVGDAVAVPILRQAIETVAPQVARLVSEPRIPLKPEMPRDAIWEEIEPLLAQAQQSYEGSFAGQLVEAVQADALAVAGYDHTRAALEAGQADILVIAEQAPLSEAARSELVTLAARTDAQVEVVSQDAAALGALGGVGALLRYRTGA